MLRFVLIAVALSPCLGVRAAPPGRLPEGWLAAVEIADLGRFDERISLLATPWGRETPSVAKLVRSVVDPALLANRPWVLALAETPGGSISPLAYIPTEDFAGLCAALDADLADDLAVATVSGFDVAIVERGDWARVSLLDAQPNAEASAEPLVSGRDADVVLRSSAAGRQRLAKALEARRRAQLRVSGRRRLPPWAWGQGVDAALARLAMAAPFFRALAETRGVIPVTLSQDAESGALRLSTDLAISPTATPAIKPPPTLTSDAPIAWLRMNQTPPAELVELFFAAMECRPGEIDAAVYAQPQWDDFAQACRLLLADCRAIDAVLTSPGEGEPVAANQVAAFDFDGTPIEFADRLNLAVARWNLLIEATRAKTPLRVVMQPLPNDEGWRLSIDLFEGMKLPRTPDLEALFHWYYGAGGNVRFDFRQIAKQRWLMTMGGEANADAIALETPGNKSTAISGGLRLDRWIQWSRTIAAARQGSDGDAHQPLTASGTPPMGFAVHRLNVGGNSALRLNAEMPVEAYRAAIATIRDE